MKNGNCPLFSIYVMGEDNFHNLWQVMSEPLFWPTKPLHNPVFYYRFIISHTFHFPHLSHVVYRSSLIQFACIGVEHSRESNPNSGKIDQTWSCCFRRSNCTDCLSGPKDGCAWCTTLNKCVSLSEYSLDYSYGECLHFQAYPTHYQSQSTTITQYVIICTLRPIIS